MNEPVIVIQTALLEYRSYLWKMVYSWGHFLTVNNRRYGRCYVKKILPLCTFLQFYTHLNWARSFQNAFYKCSLALNIFCFLKYCIFDECRHFSSCLATLTKGWVLPRKGISWRGTIPPHTDILGSWWRRWWPFSVIYHCIDFRRGEFSSVPRWW